MSIPFVLYSIIITLFSLFKRNAGSILNRADLTKDKRKRVRAAIHQILTSRHLGLRCWELKAPKHSLLYVTKKRLEDCRPISDTGVITLNQREIQTTLKAIKRYEMLHYGATVRLLADSAGLDDDQIGMLFSANGYILAERLVSVGLETKVLHELPIGAATDSASIRLVREEVLRAFDKLPESEFLHGLSDATRLGDSPDVESLRQEYRRQIEKVDKDTLKFWNNCDKIKGVVRTLYWLSFDSRRRDKLHTKASIYFGVWNSLISWILQITSVLATIFAALTIARPANPAAVPTLILTSVTALASGWAVIVTPASRSEKHRSAAARYYKLSADIRDTVLRARKMPSPDPRTPPAATVVATGTAHNDEKYNQLIDDLASYRSKFNLIASASLDTPFWATGQLRMSKFARGNPGLWLMSILHYICGCFCGIAVGDANGQGPNFSDVEKGSVQLQSPR